MKDWQATLVHLGQPIRDVIEIIDAASQQIAIVVDKDLKLIGTVTDGDVRRGLLRGIDIQQPVERIIHANPIFALEGTSRFDLHRTLKEAGIRHIPICDPQGRLVGVASASDMLEAPRRDNLVVLMAGGFGKRLRPLTETTPKPLLPVGTRPLLEITIEHFIAQGFKDFLISVNYLAEMVIKHFGNGERWDANISYLTEDEPLGTAGALSLMAQKPTRPIIVMNGDLLTTANFGALIAFHETQMADITVCARPYLHKVPYGVLELENHRVKSVKEKPDYKALVSGGIYVLSPAIVASLEAGAYLDMPDLIQSVLDRGGHVAAYTIDEYWIDIGRIEDLERARAEFQNME